MMQLACRDLGMDCNQVMTGNTVDEIKEKAMAHAKEIHPDLLKSMSTPKQLAELTATIVSKIK